MMKEIVSTISKSINEKGYYYCNLFGPTNISIQNKKESLIQLANNFGKVKNEDTEEIILTSPSAKAFSYEPFNQSMGIGWHNDFSTHINRPRLSFSWIVQADPLTPYKGNWRLASVNQILKLLKQSSLGRQIIQKISLPIFPFSYDTGGPVNYYPILKDGQLRFYRKAMEEGLKRSGNNKHNLRWYYELIQHIEECADQIGEEFEASTGALMVSHNGYALHDRLEQSVMPFCNSRKAMLCFVD